MSVEALHESLGQPWPWRRPPDFPRSVIHVQQLTLVARWVKISPGAEHLGQDSPGIDNPSIPIAPALAESLGVSQRTSQAFSKRDD